VLQGFGHQVPPDPPPTCASQFRSDLLNQTILVEKRFGLVGQFLGERGPPKVDRHLNHAPILPPGVGAEFGQDRPQQVEHERPP
jgi:hypothetical protein